MPGRSAKDQNRPELQRLKLDIAAGKIDAVICFKLDRITRSLIDFVELWRLFEKHEVGVVSLREDFDTSSVMGQALLKLIVVFAELERELTAERTAAIMLDRAERGLFNGGYVHGYRSSPDQSGSLVVDPEWAPIIRERFFDAFERLGSAGAVQRQLGKLGIWRPEWKSRTGKVHPAKPFDKQQVVRVLRNRIYLGQIRWGGTVKDGCHEAIVSQEQFDRVQRMLRQTTEKRTNHRYVRGRGCILRGLIRCGCSAMMTPKGSCGRNGTYHYYECSRRIHGDRTQCANVRIPAAALEKAVLARIRLIGTTEAARGRIVQQALKLLDDDARLGENEAATVRHRLGDVQSRIKNLVSVLVMMGEQGIASVKEELQQLEALKVELRAKLDELSAREMPRNEAQEHARRFGETWRGVGDILDQATPDEQRLVLQHYVEVIELQPTRTDGKCGTYALRLFSEVGSFANPFEDKGIGRNGKPGSTPVDAAVLTDPALVRRVDENAPRT